MKINQFLSEDRPKYGQVCISEQSLRREIVNQVQQVDPEALKELAKHIYDVELSSVTEDENGKHIYVSNNRSTRSVDHRLVTYQFGVTLSQRAKALLLRCNIKGSPAQFRAKARIELLLRGIKLTQAEFQRVVEEVLSKQEDKDVTDKS